MAGAGDIRVVRVGVPGPPGEGLGDHAAGLATEADHDKYQHILRVATLDEVTTPVEGMMAFETTTKRLKQRSGTAWVDVPVRGPSCLLTNTAEQTVGTPGTLRDSDKESDPGPATGTTGVLFGLTFNTELHDNDGMHDNVTNPWRITFISPGLYLVKLYAEWDATTGLGAGERGVVIRYGSGYTIVGGQTAVGNIANAALPIRNFAEALIDAAGSDFVTAWGIHTLDTSTARVIRGDASGTKLRFSATRIAGRPA